MGRNKRSSLSPIYFIYSFSSLHSPRKSFYKYWNAIVFCQCTYSSHSYSFCRCRLLYIAIFQYTTLLTTFRFIIFSVSEFYQCRFLYAPFNVINYSFLPSFPIVFFLSFPQLRVLIELCLQPPIPTIEQPYLIFCELTHCRNDAIRCYRLPYFATPSHILVHFLYFTTSLLGHY